MDIGGRPKLSVRRDFDVRTLHREDPPAPRQHWTIPDFRLFSL